MQSFIVVSQNPKQTEIYSEKLLTKWHINRFDRSFIGKLSPETNKQKKEKLSVGIAEVRELQEKIFQKPAHGALKAIVIKNAQTLTVEAQNALLKLLEEPPTHTYIILESTKKDAFLPTILSRCKVILLKAEKQQLSNHDSTSYARLLASFQTMSVGEKLTLAQNVTKTKDEALLWLETLTHVLRPYLNDTPNATHYIKRFQKAHTMITTTNVQPRFVIENMLLSL